MSRPTKFKFRLFVAGDAPNSRLAIANLATFCKGFVPGLYEIEVVDVFQKPKLALAESVFMTPTLVLLSPLPNRRIVGTLSDTATLLLALGLEPVAA